jgi:hypothetical protein
LSSTEPLNCAFDPYRAGGAGRADVNVRASQREIDVLERNQPIRAIGGGVEIEQCHADAVRMSTGRR